MKRHLCIDCGNTLVKAALFEGENPIADVVTGYDDLSPLARLVSDAHVSAAMMCSTGSSTDAVVATITPLISCKLTPLTHLTPLPLTIAYRTPDTLGRDRIAAAVGAWQLFTGANLLVVDAGTCVTLDVVTATGVYAGGNIAPGVEMRLKAMHEHTGLLPAVALEGEVPMLGYDTATAMRSGAVMGTVAQIESFARTVAAVTGRLKVIITGGSAEMITRHLGEINATVEPHLVLKGLNAIITYNEE